MNLETNVHEIPHNIEATEHDPFADNDHAFTGNGDSAEADAYAYGTEGTPGYMPDDTGQGSAKEALADTRALRVARAASNVTLKKGEVSLRIGGNIERERI